MSRTIHARLDLPRYSRPAIVQCNYSAPDYHCLLHPGPRAARPACRLRPQVLAARITEMAGLAALLQQFICSSHARNIPLLL